MAGTIAYFHHDSLDISPGPMREPYLLVSPGQPFLKTFMYIHEREINLLDKAVSFSPGTVLLPLTQASPESQNASCIPSLSKTAMITF